MVMRRDGSACLDLGHELAALPVHDSQVAFSARQRQEAPAAREVQGVRPKLSKAKIKNLSGCSNLCSLDHLVLPQHQHHLIRSSQESRKPGEHLTALD